LVRETGTLPTIRRHLPLILAAVLAVVATYLLTRSLAGPENPEQAYHRIHKAYLRNDHGTVYDDLTAATRNRVDMASQFTAANEARKLTDVNEAHRLLQLRGRELFVELSAKGWTLTALQWAAIDDWYVEDDAASLNVSRPPIRDLPSMGTVVLMREDGRWRLDEPGVRR
jgi:hypothetical protein